MQDLDRQLISVIIPVKLEWEPVYFVPQGQTVDAGQRVNLTFAGKKYVGVVSDAHAKSSLSPTKILEIDSINHSLSKISSSEIEFWRDLAAYYLCTVGEVYKAAYPQLKINKEEILAKIAAKEAARKAAKANAPKEIKKGKRSKVEVQPYTVANAPELNEAQETAKQSYTNTPELNEAQETAKQSYANAPELTEAQETAKREIEDAFSKGRTVLLDGVTGSGKTEIYISLAMNTLAQGRNVLYLVPEIALSRQLEERLRQYFGDSLLLFHSSETITKRVAVSEAVRNCGNGDSNDFNNNGSDMLMPAMGINDGSKDINAYGNSKKSGYIVLGTRSSLFLPHRDLGLIIVDEEQDNSYKQDSPAPRYNGRDSAALLAKIHKANLLLGSATPSLESIYNCDYGRYTRVFLSERYHGGKDAVTEIIDTKAERTKRGMIGSISIKLASAISDCLKDGGQAIVLRARKSYSTFLQCKKCGEIVQCPHCNVSLVYSKVKERMICYHCGFSMPYTGKCMKDGCNGELAALGTGTEKIEEELRNLFKDKKIERLDSDIVSPAEQKRIIKEFSKGEIDILVGTQMVSKGFDFKNLNLVALIQADGLMGVADFRADEKALQLLEQFRGRCGRRDKPGRFIIQTACPDHPIYRSLSTAAERNSYENGLMEERKEFAFPPFSRVINVNIKDKDERRIERMSTNLGLVLRGEGAFDGETASHGVICRNGQINITGPITPAVSKVSDEHIRTIRVTLPKDRRLVQRKAALKAIVLKFGENNSYSDHINIDVDPN